jgi:hypothetical protein
VVAALLAAKEAVDAAVTQTAARSAVLNNFIDFLHYVSVDL